MDKGLRVTIIQIVSLDKFMQIVSQVGYKVRFPQDREARNKTDQECCLQDQLVGE